jgi:N-acetylglucosamine kinase-like BadF-type ATPase
MSSDSNLSYEEKIQVRGLLQKILAHTQSTELTGTEHSVDDYIQMIESRQAFFDELASLAPTAREGAGRTNIRASGSNQSGLELDEEIKSIVQQIVKREEQNNLKVAGMMEDLRKALKELSNERSINSVYVKDDYESGMFFKSKN